MCFWTRFTAYAGACAPQTARISCDRLIGRLACSASTASTTCCWTGPRRSGVPPRKPRNGPRISSRSPVGSCRSPFMAASRIERSSTNLAPVYLAGIADSRAGRPPHAAADWRTGPVGSPVRTPASRPSDRSMLTVQRAPAGVGGRAPRGGRSSMAEQIRFLRHAAARPQRRHAAVLFADLSGVTALVESVEPEDVYACVRPLIDQMVALVELNGGEIQQVLGDGFMAVFGLGVQDGDSADATRAAVYTGLALVGAGAELSRLPVHV